MQNVCAYTHRGFADTQKPVGLARGRLFRLL
jgi:hypothetical protein